MFKYSRAAIKKTVNDISNLAYAATLITQSLMIIYFIFGMIVGQGYLAVNIVMCAITVAYIFVNIMTHGRKDKRSKVQKRIIGRAYRYIKLSLNAFNLITLIYSVYVSSSDITPFTLVILPLMIIMWVLQVAIELIRVYLSSLITLLIDGVEMDLEFISNPATKITNAVKGILGEEPAVTSRISDKNRDILKNAAESEADAKREIKDQRIKKVKALIKSKLPKRKKKDTQKEREMSENTK